MNEFSIHIGGFKPRNQMEQELIRWARNSLQGRKDFDIEEAYRLLVDRQDHLSARGVKGRVRISPPKVTSIWVGGQVESKSVTVHAPGRILYSLKVSEHYPSKKNTPKHD